MVSECLTLDTQRVSLLLTYGGDKPNRPASPHPLDLISLLHLPTSSPASPPRHLDYALPLTLSPHYSPLQPLKPSAPHHIYICYHFPAPYRLLLSSHISRPTDRPTRESRPPEWIDGDGHPPTLPKRLRGRGGGGGAWGVTPTLVKYSNF